MVLNIFFIFTTSFTSFPSCTGVIPFQYSSSSVKHLVVKQQSVTRQGFSSLPLLHSYVTQLQVTQSYNCAFLFNLIGVFSSFCEFFDFVISTNQRYKPTIPATNVYVVWFSGIFVWTDTFNIESSISSQTGKDCLLLIDFFFTVCIFRLK